MQAVRILAPDDQLIHQAAQRIPEEKLPTFPGAAALEFVVGLAKFRDRQPHHPTTNSKKPQRHQGHQNQACVVAKTTDLSKKTEPIRQPITLPNALRVKSAEYWLKLGQPAKALMELEKLPKSAQNHPWALKVHVAATGSAREMNCQAHAE